MPTKPKASKTSKSPRRKKKHPYPSLATTSPEQMRRELLSRPADKSFKTIEEVDQFIQEHADIWPDEKEIDEFLEWLYKARRTGKYE